ncbi:MAG: glycosyltransferase family 8 protein [Gemmatimonadota bacterium]
MAIEDIVIACAADARFIRPLAVMLQSALVHVGPDRRPAVHILHEGIEEGDQARIVSRWGHRVRVNWLRPSLHEFDDLPVWGRMPVTTYYKLAVPKLLPDSIGKVIWLDCDLIVNRDLGELWDLPLNGHPVLAAQDAFVPLVSSRFGVAGVRKLGIPPDAKYFNAGVMLVDLGSWRRERIVPRTITYLKAHRKDVFFWDQEGLNAVLAGRWGELDPRWNRSASAPSTGEAWIVHFTGGLKPWRCETSDPHCESYFRYLDMTAWSGWRPERTVRSRVLGLYAGSRWRRFLRPAERWRMQLTRRLTRAHFRTGA